MSCFSVCVLSCFSRVQLRVTLWTAALEAPLSMGFSGENTGVDCQCRGLRSIPGQGTKHHKPQLRNLQATEDPACRNC